MGGNVLKVGILTFHRAVNYGAALQAFALQRAVVKLGYECEVIDYVTVEHKKRYDIQEVSFWEKIWYPRYNPSRHEKFKKFINERVNITETSYHLKREVEQMIGLYDIVIVGSDQIWNPDFMRSNIATDVYFLNLKEVNYKIAYAPSIGSNSAKQLRKYLDYILDFDYIWMRERTVAEEMNATILAGKEPVGSIVDPVFLLSKEDWFQVARKKYSGKPYLFFYQVRQDDFSFEIAKEIAKREGLMLVVVGYHQRFFGKNVINCCDAGPEDFLNIIKNATAVVTTSFHGTALSLIMEKPFVAIEQKNNDYRLIDMLETFNMKSQYICKDTDISVVELKAVGDNSIHNSEREEALSKLCNALKQGRK